MDKKLSFSITSKSSSSNQRTLNPSHLFNDNDDLANGADNSSHYITEFSDDSSSNGIHKLVIPPIPNQFRPGKRTQQSGTPNEGDCAADQGSKESIDSILCGLNIRQSRTPCNDGGSKVSIDSIMLNKLNDDLNSLPDDGGSQQFEEVPVEGFGAALMAGYGWKEGMGIGKNIKEDVEVVQLKPRSGRQGLGFKA